MSFEKAFVAVVGAEGKYSNNPNDRGGETMYGITVAVARANGYTGAMRDMPLAIAQHIYRLQYWDTMRLDDVEHACESCALELFDTGVNCGIGVAVKMLQRALNVFNHNGKDYPDQLEDGVMGPVTLSCLRTFLSIRGDEGRMVLLRTLNCLQGERYVELAQFTPKDEDFVYGWIADRVSA